ncbi:MAG: class I SAM-dependent methyltransferase [Myxococcota bacterium]|jgi:SAM-dependent methyltransferase|nr:class I SAM-dependent methyltransferase [Myxococcota bacterium]
MTPEHHEATPRSGERDAPHPPCPVCTSPSCEVYLDAPDEPLDSQAIGQSRVHQRPGRVLRCRECGHGYRAAAPGADLLAQLYAEQDVETYLAEVPGRRRTAAAHWALVKALVPRGRLLDVGCAAGLFLELVADAGWRAVGIEPSAALCADARNRVGPGVEIECATLETATLETGVFDVVTLWDVLEHARDPRAFLAEAAAPLEPGGFLILNVPLLESAVARMLGARWPLLLPEHLHYFSRQSLRSCAEAAGLAFERFDHRLAYFTLGHVFTRLSEHDVPFARPLATLGRWIDFDDWILPVPLGEIVAVLRKPA